MSKHHVSHVKAQVFHDIECMSDTELEESYDIEIYEDGVVWDNLADEEFESITAWGQFIADQEEEENYAQFSKIGKAKWDDGGFQP